MHIDLTTNIIKKRVGGSIGDEVSQAVARIVMICLIKDSLKDVEKVELKLLYIQDI